MRGSNFKVALTDEKAWFLSNAKDFSSRAQVAEAAGTRTDAIFKIAASHKINLQIFFLIRSAVLRLGIWAIKLVRTIWILIRNLIKLPVLRRLNIIAVIKTNQNITGLGTITRPNNALFFH